MPPWKPVPGYGEFRDSYALTADEKQTILSWIANGIRTRRPQRSAGRRSRSGPLATGRARRRPAGAASLHSGHGYRRLPLLRAARRGLR